MDGVTALAEAWAAGLEVRADGDRLVVRGPRSAEVLAKRLLGCKPEVLAVLEAEDARAELDRIEADLTAKNARLLRLYGAGDRAAAERLHAEVRAIVGGRWIRAKRRRARAEHAMGRLDRSLAFLLEDPDGPAQANGYRRVPGGWVETEERAQRCVIHADWPLAPGDKLLCVGCRAEADATPGQDVGRPSLPVPLGVAPDDPRLRELATVAALAAAHRDAAGGAMSARARRLCRCGSPLAPGSADRCERCRAAWEVWASVDIWGDRVICPTCERPADGDLYPTGDGGLGCPRCLDDERWQEQAGEDG